MASRAGTKAPASDREVNHQDNAPAPLTPEQREDLLLVHLAHARDDARTLEKAMEAVRAVRKLRNRRRNNCRTDGFSLKELDAILEDEAKDRLTLETEAELRTFMRMTAGVPVVGPGQLDLFDFGGTTTKGDPNLDKDDAYYRSLGYAAGLRGEEAVAPDYVAPEFHQAFLGGRMDGQERLARGMKSYQEIEARRAPAE